MIGVCVGGIFFVVFTVLIVFDNAILHRHPERLTFTKACLFSIFWILCAVAFGCYVWYVRNTSDAFDWAVGYFLEWMLSVDNLFVFRSIFLIFKTPDEQKHKPLFWGIVGAIVFRMLFFVIEETLVHTFWWMYILLGVFLVYTGVKVVMLEEEEEDPRESPLFQFITRHIPYVNGYSPDGAFFASVPVDARTGEVLVEWGSPRSSPGASARMMQNSARSACFTPRSQGRTGSQGLPEREVVYETRATRLMLVVICLEITDVVFAVDSVSAIVAQIPDLFLAYTACVFAMLGLRATFFVVDELVKLFTLLPYAVAAILIFIGLKLIFKQWFHVPPEIVCIVLVSTLALSMVGSLVYDHFVGDTEEDEAVKLHAAAAHVAATAQETSASPRSQPRSPHGAVEAGAAGEQCKPPGETV